MQCFRDIKTIQKVLNQTSNKKGCVLTIGNFDGVHLGHSEILKQLKAESQKHHLPSVVMIFEPQPREFFNLAQAPKRLTSLREKKEWLHSFGIDYLFIVHFNAAFSNLDAEEWLEKTLLERLQAKVILIGEDFHFGHQRAGTAALLQQKAQEHHFEVQIIAAKQDHNQRISSTLIRSELAQDHFERAAQLLGRSYSIQGKVIYGNQLARQLGFPTANIKMDRKNPALHGVYFVKVQHLESHHTYFGVANIGFRPTIQGKKAVLEVHLFDFDQMIYGDHLKIEFIKKIREEKKFDSLEDLKSAIVQDICKARQIQAELKNHS